MTETVQNPAPEDILPAGLLKSIARVIGAKGPSRIVLEQVARQKKPGGVMRVSSARLKSVNHRQFEFCEISAKATISHLTSARCTPAF